MKNEASFIMWLFNLLKTLRIMYNDSVVQGGIMHGNANYGGVLLRRWCGFEIRVTKLF